MEPEVLGEFIAQGNSNIFQKSNKLNLKCSTMITLGGAKSIWTCFVIQYNIEFYNEFSKHRA